MINQNEIRIGNYFEHDDSWNYAGHKGIFQWTDRDWYALGESTLFLDGIKPIELDEEVLLKCGFLNPSRCSYFTLNKWFEIKEEDEMFYYDLFRSQVVELKSLHHLQNLFFALTGKELEIKL